MSDLRTANLVNKYMPQNDKAVDKAINQARIASLSPPSLFGEVEEVEVTLDKLVKSEEISNRELAFVLTSILMILREISDKDDRILALISPPAGTSIQVDFGSPVPK